MKRITRIPNPRALSKIAVATSVGLILAAASLVTVSLAPSSLAAQEPPAVEEDRVLEIGLIGAGSMGGPLGQLWADAGHDVIYSSRNPEELMDLVRSAAPRATAGYADAASHFGEVVVLAVPPSAVPQLGEDYGHLMEGKIVIDITNPRVDRDGEITNEWLEMGTGVAMAQYLPGARVVKAFNTLAAGMLTSEAHRDGELVGVPVAGDDDEAVETVMQLVRDAGFEPVYVGDLESASRFDRGTPVWVTGMTADEIREEMGL